MFPYTVGYVPDMQWCGFSTQSCRKKGRWEVTARQQFWPKVFWWWCCCRLKFSVPPGKLPLKLLFRNELCILSGNICTWIRVFVRHLFLSLTKGVSQLPLTQVQKKGLSKPHFFLHKKLRKTRIQSSLRYCYFLKKKILYIHACFYCLMLLLNIPCIIIYLSILRLK